MSKRRLTEDELIEELNKKLREDNDYEQGMAFVPYPEYATSSEMSGYATTGPFNLTGVYARVSQKVFDESELK